MADFSNIIEEINTNLPDNNSQAITAEKLRSTLVDLTNQVGDSLKFSTDEDINTVGIINNLVTGGEHNVLSAEQGKLIKEGFSRIYPYDEYIVAYTNSAIKDNASLGELISLQLDVTSNFRVVRYEINQSNSYYGSGPAHSSYNRYVYYWGDAEEKLLKKETLRSSTSSWTNYQLVPPQDAKYLYVNEISASSYVNQYSMKVLDWVKVESDETKLDNPIEGTLAIAEDVMPVKSTLNGVLLNETKIELVDNTNYFTGFYVNASTGKIASSSGWRILKINIGGVNSVRFVGYKANTTTSTGYGFCNDEPTITVDYAIDETIRYEQYTGSSGNKEYIVSVPADKKWMVITVPSDTYIQMENFYCYTQVGFSVKEEIDKVQDEIEESLYEIQPVTIQPVLNPDTNSNYVSIEAVVGHNIVNDYVSSTTQKIDRYEIEGGKKYFLSGWWFISADYTIATWTDINKTVLKIEQFRGNTNDGLYLTDKEIIAPTNARYLYLVKRTANTATNPILKEYNKIDIKRQIRLLIIGNSYSQDALAYVPFIFPKITNKVLLTIGILYLDGASLNQHLTNLNNASETYRFHLSENGNPWTTQNDKSIQYALENYKWDIVLTHQKSNYAYNYTTYQPDLDMLINKIQESVTYPIKFGWMLVQSRPGNTTSGTPNFSDELIETHYENISTYAQNVLNETLCEFVIPWGTAIQNARTLPEICALGRYANTDVFPSNTSGLGYLTYDGVHLQEGLPCLIAAYTVILSLLSICGENYNSIIGDDTVPTSTWISNKSIPGANGSPVGATIENTRIAQKCAIMAFKKPYAITDMTYIVNPT